MIASKSTGSHFGGLQGYLLHGRANASEAGLQEYLLDAKGGADRVEWVSSRNLPTEDPRYAAAVMTATAEENPRVTKPVYHLSLSADPGETLTREDWERVVDRVLGHLGLDDRQVLVVAHNDTHHPHVHLMINRVHPEHFKAWSDSHDYRRIEQALRHIERDFKLREVPGHHYQLSGQQPPEREGSPTRGERHQTERTGEASWADRIRFKLYDDLRAAESWGDLERRLATHGLRLERRGGGLVLTDGQHRVKASRVYRRASYKWLEQRFGMGFEDWRRGKRDLVAAVAHYQAVEKRRQHLDEQVHRAWGAFVDAKDLIDERARVRSACREASATVDQQLAELYRASDLPAVRRRLVATARRHGWLEAARRLQEQPRRFGRLRRAWGRTPSGLPRRRHRQILVRRLVSSVTDLSILRSARLLAGAPGFRAAESALVARRSWRRAIRRRDALPPSKTLLKEIAGRTIALGISSVSLVVAPNPLKVVRVALRAGQLTRAISRGLSR